MSKPVIPERWKCYYQIWKGFHPDARHAECVEELGAAETKVEGLVQEIAELKRRLSKLIDLSCNSCEMNDLGHAYDCPEAQA